jgi:hypothetical protein
MGVIIAIMIIISIYEMGRTTLSGYLHPTQRRGLLVSSVLGVFAMKQLLPVFYLRYLYVAEGLRSMLQKV